MAVKVYPTPHVVVTDDDGSNYRYNIYVGRDLYFKGELVYDTYTEAAYRGRQWINREYELGRLPYYGEN